ncbi:exonuclease SbcCD subunit D C-terminal domain-containing protein [Neolewinella antarctica]|uniref:Nuclease SbcCD subunit D n=1 Tax=Neolewinella antarctica TaxID=442734 RepID=A0ABX0XBE5_9BACT|nr:exonuclease SbcCD subunit D C-terminal domain-containing protein [Neolewinella antarctica]NJC26390.1 exonuclease SbcD [Neolewinella antarctica]
MRILHTADWHLGHRLYDQDRTPEHTAALAWLLELIELEKIDVVIIAGDIFDVTNPSNQARELYYGFLSGLLKSSVKGAIVVGGNHDSPSMLDAPRQLMQALNLHVVGAARSQVQDQVVKLGWGEGLDEEELVVAAVPFLRERDVRKSKFGETTEERKEALRQGIQAHFEAVAEAAKSARSDDTVPIVATGHLFVGGATDAEDKKSHIYQADENNIEAGQFPDCFDYVALGHVHRAQSIDGNERVRYCGSLIPLTFVEGQRQRSVRIVDVNKAGEPISTRKVFVPSSRPLHRLHGEWPKLEKDIQTLVADWKASDRQGLLAWGEVRIKSDELIPNLREKLADCVREALGDDADGEPIRFLRASRDRLNPAPASAQKEMRELDELEPADVFKIVCEAEDLSPALTEEVTQDFRALINWHQDQDQAATA